MTRPNQLLVAAACIAILSALAYFVWSDYSARELAALTARCEESAREQGAALAAIAGRPGPSDAWLDNQVRTCVSHRLR